MLSHIRRLGAETAVYGISTIVGRFLSFLLVPFYTNVLSTSQYGIVANIYSYIAFLNVLYSYGMESAYFRYASLPEIGDTKQQFSTPFLSVLVTSSLFTGLMCVFAVPLTSAFLIAADQYRIIRYAAGILLFDALAIIPFASLRLAQKAKLFAFLKLVNITANVVFNVVALLWLHWGVEGIFISGLASSALTFLLLIPFILPHLTFRFSWPLYRALLRFGLPYIPVGLAGMVLQVIDRPMLKAFTNDSVVGIYQANYRLGIFMNLVTSMFDYAWKPFFLSHARDENAKPLFARILTYFVALTVGLFLLLSFFIHDLVSLEFFGRHLIHPAYWSGLGVVPVVLLAYVFGGLSINFNAGILIEKKTAYLLPTSLAAALSNIVANYFLIPVWGLMGAAYATLIAYALGAAALFVVVQHFYPVRYEYGRLLKIAITGGGVYCAFLFLGGDAALALHSRFLLLIAWIALLAMSGFFTPEEKRRVGILFGRSR